MYEQNTNNIKNIIEPTNINSLIIILKKLTFSSDIEFRKKIKTAKIIKEKIDDENKDFYSKQILIDNLIFYYTYFNNGTKDGEHFLNINNYKIFDTSLSNKKIKEKYKNNISFLFEEMNFIDLTENMFTEFIITVFDFMKIQ